MENMDKYIEKFEFKCKECPKIKAKYFCVNDNVFYCNGCKNIRNYNSYWDIEKYKMATLFFNYNKLTENFPNIQDYNYDMDEKNKFLLIDYDSFLNIKKLTIFCGPKWKNCGLDEKDPFLSVSFVGNTGSGKSSTIGNICIDYLNNHPVPGLITSSKSTSAEINSFLGQTDDVSKLKYLILDSEGGSGSFVPEMLNRKLSKFQNLCNEKDASELLKKRIEFIKYSYPKLLYNLSDVFVFTFIGSHKEQHIVSEIIGYTKISTCSFNNFSKPHLIILFNKQPLDLKNDNIENSTNNYFEQQKENLNELKKYYQSVSVFYLPDIGHSNSINQYINEIASFKKLINEKIKISFDIKTSKNHDFTTKKILNTISQMVENFNINGAKDVQDFSKIYHPLLKFDSQFELKNEPDQSATSSLSKDIKETVKNILIYFGSCYQFLIEKENYIRKEAFENSKLIIKYKLPKIYDSFIKRNNLTDNKKTIPDSFIKVLEDISTIIHKKYAPCQYKVNGLYDCINYQDTHGCHKSAEFSYEAFSFFKMNFKRVKTHYDGEGTHIPPEKENFVEFFTKNYKSNVEIDELINKTNFFKYQNVCIGCLYGSPTIPFTCNHIICSNCAKNSKHGICSIEKCGGSARYKKEIDFNSLMGCRILSLDGGGIRGISECCILEKISIECYDIPIYILFDLIVGTSTGALIALALVATENTPTNIITLFEGMAKDVFSNLIIKVPVVGQFYSFLFTKYGRKTIHECIKKVLEDKTLFQSFEKSRVAVTTVTNNADNWEDVLFLNYFRKIDEIDQPKYINDALCSDGAEASSAAPFYFTPFVFKEKIYLDGGLTNNNPCKVALKESQLLWPDKKIDLFLSIGTGLFKNKTNFHYSQNIAKNEEKYINLYIESEKSWKEIKEILKENNNLYRYNVEFECEIGLDNGDNDTINDLKNVSKLFLSSYNENNTIKSIINKSLSSLFYLDMVSYNTKLNTLNGKIKCRYDKLPNELCKQLNQKKNCFYIRNNKTEEITDILIKKNEIIKDKPIEMEFTIFNTPVEIDIICTLVGKSNIVNEASISGCPFLKSDFNKLNIKSI